MPDWARAAGRASSAGSSRERSKLAPGRLGNAPREWILTLGCLILTSLRVFHPHNTKNDKIVTVLEYQGYDYRHCTSWTKFSRIWAKVARWWCPLQKSVISCIKLLITSISIIINNNHIKNLIQEISRKNIIDFHSYTTHWSLCAILNVKRPTNQRGRKLFSSYFSVYLQIQLKESHIDRIIDTYAGIRLHRSK